MLDIEEQEFFNNITIEDCIDLFEMKGISVLVSNGNIVGFTDNKN